jgi:hypothetical protein
MELYVNKIYRGREGSKVGLCFCVQVAGFCTTAAGAIAMTTARKKNPARFSIF